MKFIVRFFGWLFSNTALGLLGGLGFFLGLIGWFMLSTPSIDSLKVYNPSTTSRVYSGEGLVLDEFASQKRLYTPSDEIPDLVKWAFISAEDKNFYEHGGYDVRGMVGAVRDSISGEGRGASTIPQQIAKNFLLSGEQTVERKIRELIIARRMVETLDREHLLSLYLNEIFLGQNSYGVTAAARTYFNKTLEELSLEEIAYLAANPKAPSEYHPVRNYDAAVERRNFVLREMMENGYITVEEMQTAQAKPLLTVQSGDYASAQSERPPRGYFTDEIRRQLSEQFGEEELFSEGLSVRATIDQNLQDKAQAAFRKGLEDYDRSQAEYHGAIAQIDAADLTLENWQEQLKNTTVPRDIEGWFPAVVLALEGELSLGVEGHEVINLPLDSYAWARYQDENGNRQKASSPSDMFKIGDVIYVSKTEEAWSFRQIPEVSGAFAAIDPRNGRVLSLVGGFSYEDSNFNRATQAMRQPGSAFKPFVYAAALDAGYTPNAVIVDAPIAINTPQGLWEPKNASNKFYGPSPMMTGLERSRNLMTVRLAQDVGMDIVADYGERYGVYDDMLPVLANALGSQETTLYRLIAAYSTFANGGKGITPTVVDRVQDRFGQTIYTHDERECVHCEGADTSPSIFPEVISRQAQVMDPVTAYQIQTMLKMVVAYGTASGTVGKLGLPIAGKTGTTNDAKDAWFVGFTPKIVAGCYMGFDDPRSLGRGASGGGLCGPVFVDFIQEALKTYGGFDMPVPEGGSFVKLDRKTGQRLPDDATGDNVVNMLFNDNKKPRVGEGGIFIDGGFGMGSDFILIEPGAELIEEEENVVIDGESTAIPTNPSIGTISTGGLY